MSLSFFSSNLSISSLRIRSWVFTFCEALSAFASACAFFYSKLNFFSYFKILNLKYYNIPSIVGLSLHQLVQFLLLLFFFISHRNGWFNGFFRCSQILLIFTNWLNYFLFNSINLFFNSIKIKFKIRKKFQLTIAVL